MLDVKSLHCETGALPTHTISKVLLDLIVFYFSLHIFGYFVLPKTLGGWYY